jgi:hypothetical protein
MLSQTSDVLSSGSQGHNHDWQMKHEFFYLRICSLPPRFLWRYVWDRLCYHLLGCFLPCWGWWYHFDIFFRLITFCFIPNKNKYSNSYFCWRNTKISWWIFIQVYNYMVLYAHHWYLKCGWTSLFIFDIPQKYMYQDKYVNSILGYHIFKVSGLRIMIDPY